MVLFFIVCGMMGETNDRKGVPMMRIVLALMLCALIALSCAAPVLGEEAALPSLRDVYAGRFDIGVALPGYAFSNAALLDLVKGQFTILTPENELKPDAVLDVNLSRRLAQEDETAAAVHFDAARPLLDFAKANGLKVHGHTLVWHSQTPEEFFHEGYDKNKAFVSRDVMLGRLENYIRNVMEYMDNEYPGVVVSWDVVNEAVDDGGMLLRRSNWTTVVGEDFVFRAFEYARRYAPEGTLLYYNDYLPSTSKLERACTLVENLKAEGNIDGFGDQMHVSVTGPSTWSLTAELNRISNLGLRIRISELDIGMKSATEENLKKQAEIYAHIMLQALRHADQMEAVQFWGMTDSMTWRTGESPLLFDGKMQPKPAFWAVADPENVN